MKEFELFTDPDRMRILFQEQLPEFSRGLFVITRCRVLRSRYRTELNECSERKHYFSVRYQLEVTDRDRRRHGVQMLYAKVVLEGDCQEDSKKVGASLVSSPAFGEGSVYLPKLGMVVWIFPNDPKLSQLSELVDPEKVKKYLPYNFPPSGLEGPRDITHVMADVVRYHPEVRCTIRYRLAWGPSELPQTITLYGKTFEGGRGERLFRLMRHLWAKSIEDQASFMIAQPLGYNEAVQTIWQQALVGTPLMDVIDSTNHKGYLESVARSLASLHKSDLSDVGEVTTRDQLPAIRKKLDGLMQSFPQFRETLEAISLRLETDFSHLTPMVDKPAHGSFRIKEVLVCGKRLAVFDLDNIAIGDSVRDLALFLVDLHCQYHDKSLLSSMTTTFFQAYRSQVNWDVSVDRLNWHIRVQFIKRADWIYKNHRLSPRLKNKIEETIALAQSGIALDSQT